jgi:predicted dienelactone hydrolase
MRPVAFFTVIAVCLAGPMAEAAGFRFIEVPADASGPALKGAVWYPCAAPPQEVKITASMSIGGALDCPVQGNKLPLVVISTGGSGWFASHNDTAERWHCGC